MVTVGVDLHKRVSKVAALTSGREMFRHRMENGAIEDHHKKALDTIRWEVATKFDPVQIPFIAGPKMRVSEPHIRKKDIPRFEEAHARGGRR